MTIFGLDLTPEIRRIIKEEQTIMDRSIDVTCAWGTCNHIYDPVAKHLVGGWGDVFCGCENLPGWRARHPEGLPKPSVPIKAKGRHGSRIQRSRRRKQEWLDWRKQVAYDIGQHSEALYPVVYDEIADFQTAEALNQ